MGDGGVEIADPDRVAVHLTARRIAGAVNESFLRAAAGEHVSLLVSSVSSTLNYRLEATLAPSAP
jgi:hypothetical protein